MQTFLVEITLVLYGLFCRRRDYAFSKGMRRRKNALAIVVH